MARESYFTFYLTMVLAFMIVSMTGCATVPADRPSWCEGEDSLVYDVADRLHVDPKAVARLIIFGNIQAVQHDAVKADDIRAALSSIRMIIDHGIPTYSDILNVISVYISELNRDAGTTIAMASIFFDELNKPIPISECDRQNFLWALDEQERWLDSFFPKEKAAE